MKKFPTQLARLSPIVARIERPCDTIKVWRNNNRWSLWEGIRETREGVLRGGVIRITSGLLHLVR